MGIHRYIHAINSQISNCFIIGKALHQLLKLGNSDSADKILHITVIIGHINNSD